MRVIDSARERVLLADDRSLDLTVDNFISDVVIENHSQSQGAELRT